ncbi:WD40 repeat protein [Krasilnikovia cinnamomea]|uniref:WD40 repeat protein n=1 Tax=Krasilnikovia cinnamomea TaxID=349313 RepID=A0A4Q7ZMR5_9ACTN|nr:choice-of-anchor D domain-containing protein [Krasilnikovia cinnamomea]RZU51569.1 WD40 repeat protein [Krasilnikovia cinnamomea]
MPRQRTQVHRMMLAGGLAAALGTTAVVVGLTFANDSAAAETGSGTQRVSVGTSGVQAAFDSSEPAISADGRYVAFTTDEPFDPVDKLSTSQNSSGTVPEPGPDADVYVRDSQVGTTTLISHGLRHDSDDELGDSVVPADGNSYQPSISDDGRFVAFRTNARNIAPDAGRTHAIVVCDRDPDGDGKFSSACRFTVVSGDDFDPSNPHLSGDGRRISYDVPPHSPPVPDTPVLLLKAHSTPLTAAKAPAAKAAAKKAKAAARKARKAPAPETPDPRSGWVEVVELRRGDDGRLLTPQDDDRAYVTSPDRLDGDDSWRRLRWQGESTMSALGTHVAFVARYSDFESPSVYVVQNYDVNTMKLTRLDLDADGKPIAKGGRRFRSPALSGDGRRYAFTDRQDLGPTTVRLYDRDPDGDGTFGPPSVEIASRKADGSEAEGTQPAFSADGRYLAFTTPTPGMHNGTDAGGRDGACLGSGVNLSFCDIVVRDLVLDAARAKAGEPRLPAELASPSTGCATKPQPCEGTGDSGLLTPTGDGSQRLDGEEWVALFGEDGSPVLNADGSVVAYGSEAADLVGDDKNKHLDVFRRRFAPALAADPQDFGQVPLGSQVLRDVPLTHVGAGPLRVREVAVDGADFDVFPGETCTAQVLHASEKCVVSIRFRPGAAGPRSAVLRVGFDGSDTPLTVSLTGAGLAPSTPPDPDPDPEPEPEPEPGVFAAAPDRLDFGDRPVLRTSPAKSVTVRNTGAGPLRLGAVGLSASLHGVDYRVTADTCANRSIPAAGSCRVDVTHRPTAVGSRPAVLTIAYEGATGTTLTFPVSLTGAGLAPTLTSSPTVTPAGRVIQVRGTGFPPNSVSKLHLTGMPGSTTAKARGDGTFSVPFVVFPNTWTGKHPLTADVLPASAPGLTAPLKATLEFVIVPGSPLPPDFDIRR